MPHGITGDLLAPPTVSSDIPNERDDIHANACLTCFSVNDNISKYDLVVSNSRSNWSTTCNALVPPNKNSSLTNLLHVIGRYDGSGRRDSHGNNSRVFSLSHANPKASHPRIVSVLCFLIDCCRNSSKSGKPCMHMYVDMML